MRLLIAMMISLTALSAGAQSSESDRTTYTALQSRISVLRAAQASAYHVAKAQCWLDASSHEHTRNDRSAFPREAREQAAQLVDSLEQRASPLPANTPLIDASEHVRPDLWNAIAALRQSPGAICAAEKTACAEVKLVHAGHEHRQLGWRRARPYVEVAADWVAEAQQAASQCK